MASLSHQSAINPDKSFWLSSQTPTIPYATPLTFDVTPDGSSTANLQGRLSTLYIQAPYGVAFSLPNSLTGKCEINPDATQANQLAGLYVSSPIQCDTFVNTPALQANTLNISTINAIPQKPGATRFGTYTQSSGGTGTTAVANTAIGATSIILVQAVGNNANSNAVSYSANPVAGVGFASIANAPLTNPQTMAYFVASW